MIFVFFLLSVIQFEALSSDLNYIQTGSGGEHIVFVHGTPGSLNAFKPYQYDVKLKKLATMVSVDRPGFGKTSGPAEIDLSNHALRVANTLKKNWPDKTFTCVGHSYGAPVCLQAVQKFPDLFKGTILISGAVNPNRKILKWYNHWAKTWFVKLILPKAIIKSNKEMFAIVDPKNRPVS